MLKQLRALIGGVQQEANNMSFLTQSPAAQALDLAGNPDKQLLTTNTKFAVSQLPALRSLLDDLRPKLNALKSLDCNASRASAKEEIKEERRGYIEQRTRSHLERNGINPAENSSLLFAKRVDEEEVHALEKVASIFDQT